MQLKLCSATFCQPHWESKNSIPNLQGFVAQISANTAPRLRSPTGVRCPLMPALPKPTLNWTNLIDFVPSSFAVLELIVCPSKANLRSLAFPKTRLYLKCIMLQILPVFHDSHCRGLLKLVHVHFDRAQDNTQRTCTKRFAFKIHCTPKSHKYVYIYNHI